MIVYTVHYSAAHDVTAIDRGGAYIDLYTGACLVNAETGAVYRAPDGIVDGEATAFDLINVWDYRAGQRRELDMVGDHPDYAALIAEKLEEDDDA